MPPAGLATTLAGIEIITDRLAAHNTGEKVLSPAEEHILLLELGTLNRNIERCMRPAPKPRSSRIETTREQVLYLIIVSVLVTCSAVAMGLMLHAVYSSFATSIMMHPGP